MVTDTTGEVLEALITTSLTNNGWLPGGGGDPQDYERAHCVDLSHLSDFLQATQPETAASLDLAADSTTRRRFLDRIKREITSRGIIDVLRKGSAARTQRDNPLLRDSNPGQHPGRRALPAEPVLRHPATQVQRQQPATVPGHRSVRERPTGHHHGTQEPVHRPDRRRRRGAIQNIPKPAGGPLQARPVRRPLRRRR